MTALAWDQVGERLYETGVDHGVLYLINNDGEYDLGVAWNGLTTVTESPSGAESNPQFADNIKYLNLLSAEEFGATIEAFTYPEEFAECDGSAVPAPGVIVGQQGRKVFGLAYRTKLGNDIEGVDHGYKLHLVYGAQASPSEKAYATINDSPEAIAFSWEVATTPVPVTGLSPTSLLVIDSTEVDADGLADLEEILFGSVSDDARLPMPDEVISIVGGTVTDVDLGTPANQPTYNAGTHVVTLPAVTGVVWEINGEEVSSGAQPALTVGQSAHVEAKAASGYNLVGSDDWDFDY
jgi:hypothetical protein